MQKRIYPTLLIACCFFLSLAANAQYFDEKQRKTDSLWAVIHKVETKYTDSLYQKKYRVSIRGKRTRLKGYNKTGLLVYREKTRYFKSGIARRKTRGFSTFLAPEILNSKGNAKLKKFKHQTFELRSYGNSINYAIIRNDLNQVVLRVLNNNPLILP